MKNLDKTYNPSNIEDKLYQNWVERGYFKASHDEGKPPFTIVIPPPNVTGQLHMGHALDETLQDILIRFKRMQGYSALWLPGTDHAGIATQIKVEEVLRKEEGKTRYDLGREKFLERVWDWKNKFGSRIISQLKKLGSSCDWSRERFTMDAEYSKAVKEVFVKLYNKGLIYKGNRIINWCPSCATALSDTEVEYTEQEGFFWHIKYPLADGSGSLEIATTRPETLLGDTAVAVNPNDERYKDIVGKMLILPLVNKEIPVIADDYVDMEFGTGAVKITPAHDPNDFEVGLRHNLEQIKVLNDDATINKNGGKYEGLDRYEARKVIVEDLEKEGYLVKVVPHSHNVGECYRCKTTVEPTTSDQWFVKMAPLAKEAIEVVRDGRIEFVPERFSKTYMNWMENVHDWCISRQLWWGHRIPAFTCEHCDEMVISAEDAPKCPKCGGEMKQESDVLDTWFSSALWPFATLGWPENTKDLNYYYPTSVLVTGYDIIFFWVARMIFSGMEHMSKEPFKHVFIHGLVRDSQGRKMSKSLNNGVDPLEVIKEYGADALRFTLATGNSPGNDMRYSDEKVKASRNFANKLWNAARFVMMNLDTDEIKLPENPQLEDKWILSKYNTLVKEVTENLENFDIGVAVSKLYDFVWDIYCDWYIELVKPRLYDEANETRKDALYTLSYVLAGVLKLLHPFMPFITEEIYISLPVSDESIVISEWPKANEALSYKDEEAAIEIITDAIKKIRNIRAERNIAPSKKSKMIIATDNSELFSKGVEFFKKLAYASEVEITKESDAENCISIVVSGAQILLPVGELMDLAAEKERLEKEKKRLEGEIKRAEGKLSNQGFIAKAPQKLVDEEKAKLAKYREMYETVCANLKSL